MLPFLFNMGNKSSLFDYIILQMWKMILIINGKINEQKIISSKYDAISKVQRQM